MALEKKVGPEHAQKGCGESGKPTGKKVEKGKGGSPPRRKVPQQLGNRNNDPGVVQGSFNGGHAHPDEEKRINGNGRGEGAPQKPDRKGGCGDDAQHQTRPWRAVAHMEVPGEKQRGGKQNSAHRRAGKGARNRITRGQNGEGQMGYCIQSCLHRC
jgi:hypothetical protein